MLPAGGFGHGGRFVVASHDLRGKKAPLRQLFKAQNLLSADYVFGAAVALVVACSLYFGPRIKGERVAMQWGSDGKPT
jgi:hypothetical protein